MLNLRLKDRRIKPQWSHYVVSLSKTFYPLRNPRNVLIGGPEKLLTDKKQLKQTDPDEMPCYAGLIIAAKRFHLRHFEL